jgi:hypothetical protein
METPHVRVTREQFASALAVDRAAWRHVEAREPCAFRCGARDARMFEAPLLSGARLVACAECRDACGKNDILAALAAPSGLLLVDRACFAPHIRAFLDEAAATTFRQLAYASASV